MITLLRTREFRDISVADISQTANVAVGTVYRHFANKEAFLEALIRNRIALIQTRLSQETVAIPEDWSLNEIFNLVLKEALNQIREDAPILRTLLTYRPAYPELNDDVAHIQKQALNRVEALLEACGDRVPAQSQDIAARQIFHVLNTLFIDCIIAIDDAFYWAEAPNEKTRIEETTKMIVQYLKRA